jgi:hypothetical protein
VSILKSGLKFSDEKNYSPYFFDINSNLFYILQHGRFIDGAYYVIEEDGKYIASAGWNRYNHNTALVLARAFVSKPYRTTYIMGEMLLPLMLEECKNFENVWITCNENNRAIYDWFERSANGMKPTLFNNWPDIYKRFKPIGEMSIYYTQQLVAQLER